MPAGALAESEAAFDESKHPRGDDGRFVSGGDISAAIGNAAKAAELRKRVTDPVERAKLDKALGSQEVKQKPKKSKATIRHESGQAAESVDRAVKRITGGNTPGHEAVIPSVVGAPDKAKVYLSTEGGKLKVRIQHPAYEAVRSIGRTKDGEKIIVNETFFMKGSRQGAGLGSEVFASQVEHAQAEGFKAIMCHAAKDNPREPSKPHNGYYTWPRMGYDAPLAGVTGASAVKAFPGSKTVLDVMATKEGRDWWKANGTDLFDAKFDLTPGSRSMKVHEAYMAERAARSKSVAESLEENQPAPAGGVEEIELSPEEEAALDAAWERLEKAG